MREFSNETFYPILKLKALGTKRVLLSVALETGQWDHYLKLLTVSLQELDALGDELEFEDEEIPSYLQEDELELPKISETDPSKAVRCSFTNFLFVCETNFLWVQQHQDVKLDEFGLPVAAEAPMKA